jgi:hypothetical protein
MHGDYGFFLHVNPTETWIHRGGIYCIPVCTADSAPSGRGQSWEE